MKGTIYYVTGDGLNVRSGPGTSFDKWEKLYKGDRIIADGEPSNGWLPIQMDDETVAFVSEQFVSVEVVQPEIRKVEPGYSILDSVNKYGELPIWLDWMLDKRGLEEVPGAGDNPEIIEWMKLTTLPRSMWHDSTAWCSVTVNAAFMLNDMKGTRSAAAKDWLQWGVKITKPQLGCIVVFVRKNSDGEVVGHHVGCFLQETVDKVQVVGGNQSNAITEQWYSKKSILGYRWPKE